MDIECHIIAAMQERREKNYSYVQVILLKDDQFWTLEM